MEADKPKPSELAYNLEQYIVDNIWANAQSAELRQVYPGQWIAVFNQEVVGADEDMIDLINSLRKQDYSTSEVVVINTDNLETNY